MLNFISMEIHWQSEGRNEVWLRLDRDDEAINAVEMKAIGDLDFLHRCQDMKAQLLGPIGELPTLEGTDMATLIWLEILGRIKKEWTLPVEHDELCHCRQVSTRKVDEAVVFGAHTLSEIRRQTSANTGCGTCLGDIKKLVQHRLKRTI